MYKYIWLAGLPSAAKKKKKRKKREKTKHLFVQQHGKLISYVLANSRTVTLLAHTVVLRPSP